MLNIENQQHSEIIAEQQVFVTTKQLDTFISAIKPKANCAEQYQQSLSKWLQFTKAYKSDVKKAYLTLRRKPKLTPNTPDSTICQVCYQQMTKNRSWCRICGEEACERCIVRLRVVKDWETPVKFCEKCDREYLKAIITKEQLREFELLEKAFLKLAEEQQRLQTTYKLQRKKAEKEGGDDNLMLQKLKKIQAVSNSNNTLKNQIKQIKRKIEWGDQKRDQLKQKLVKMKKDISLQTFQSSSFILDQTNGHLSPVPDSSKEHDEEFINESLIASMLESENAAQQTLDEERCSCAVV